jgi:pyruvate/2-oxoglutarate/acetoin dehydrogenase E1 component
MRIIDAFNKILRKYILPNSILYGQNINKGSRIAGMTNFLDNIKKAEVINTQNSENSLVGFGLGLALGGKTSIYFVKQLDFILLGIDHIVNTLNSLVLEKVKGSFSIITYIVDSGYEGPQSRFHSLQEISNISHVNCIYLIFPDDIEYNLKKINKKIFNIFCLSQKHSRLDINPKCLKKFDNGKILKYSSGNKATVVSIGFASYYAYDKIIKNSINDYDFFVISNPISENFDMIIQSARKTKKILLFDDSRSPNKNFLDKLELVLNNHSEKIKVSKYYKKDEIIDLYINKDDYQPIIDKKP